MPQARKNELPGAPLGVLRPPVPRRPPRRAGRPEDRPAAELGAAALLLRQQASEIRILAGVFETPGLGVAADVEAELPLGGGEAGRA